MLKNTHRKEQFLPAQWPDQEHEPVGPGPAEVVVEVLLEPPEPRSKFLTSAVTRLSPMQRKVLKLVM
jgi:hypothetical protein